MYVGFFFTRTRSTRSLVTEHDILRENGTASKILIANPMYVRRHRAFLFHTWAPRRSKACSVLCCSVCMCMCMYVGTYELGRTGVVSENLAKPLSWSINSSSEDKKLLVELKELECNYDEDGICCRSFFPFFFFPFKGLFIYLASICILKGVIHLARLKKRIWKSREIKQCSLVICNL